ncbi:hypothetical protein V498_01625 [Pseudogymnoascus sp. VKM F-4517 (FW-2822)]|nr:hypothetical protein V498_01625 [Pseudogymnoascus sp. VKM F-4517 (FW-2822)]
MTLQDLPPEILNEIANSLSYGSQLALKLSCRGLFAKIDAVNARACSDLATSPTKSYSMADLLEIEQWPEYNAAKFMPDEAKQPMGQRDFFACHIYAENSAAVYWKGLSAFVYSAGSLIEDIRQEHTFSLAGCLEGMASCAVLVADLKLGTAAKIK